MKKLIFILLVTAACTAQAQTRQHLPYVRYDISDFSATDTVILECNRSIAGSVAIAVVYNIDAASGSFNVYQSNNRDSNYVAIDNTLLPHSVSTTTDVINLSLTRNAFEYMPIIFTKGGASSGTIDIYFRNKE